MSVTNGGTALKPFSSGGSFSGSAGSAGISITLRTAHLPFLPPSSRYHIQMEDERSFRETTTPTNPKVFLGSCDGPKFEHHLLLRAQVNFLQVAALIQIPDVQFVAVLSGQQQLRD